MTSTDSSYAPAPLVCAVSRRFNNPESDALFFERIDPVLKAHAVVLNCSFASDDRNDLDFWMNRMNIILDLADIHLLLDVDRSANTFYELQASILCSRYGPGASLLWNFGVRAPTDERPLQIVVFNGAEPRTVLAFAGVALGVSRCIPLRGDTATGVLEDALSQMLRDRKTSLDMSRSRNAADPGLREYWEAKTTLAHALADGLTPSEIFEQIMRPALEDEPASARDEFLHFLDSQKDNIVQYNQDLSDLASACASILSPKTRFRDSVRSTRRFIEVGLEAAALRGDSNFSAVSSIIKTAFKHPLLRIPFGVLALKTAIKMRGARYSLGANHPVVRGMYRNPILRTILVFLVLCCWYVPAIWVVDRVSGGGRASHVVAGTVLALLFVVSVLSGRVAAAAPGAVKSSTPSARQGRRYRWYLEESPAVRKIVTVLITVLAISFWSWVGLFVLPAWLGQYERGGQAAVRVALVAIISFLVINRLIANFISNTRPAKAESVGRNPFDGGGK